MKTLFASATLCLLVLAGCQTSDPARAPYGGETRLDPYTGVGVNVAGRLNEDLTLDPVPFLGKFLPNQEVRIIGVTAAPNAQALPQVQFSIQSQKDKKQAFQYRFIWMDGDGFVIQPDQSPWQTLHLQGREVGFIGSTARTPSARAFQLMIRPLDFKK